MTEEPSFSHQTVAFAHRDENILIQVPFPQGIMVCVCVCVFQKPGSSDSGNENGHSVPLGLITAIIRILELALFHFTVAQE